MRCQKCGGDIPVTHTVRALETAIVRSRKCVACGQRYTEVGIIEPANKYGEGYWAVAKKLRKKKEVDGQGS